MLKNKIEQVQDQIDQVTEQIDQADRLAHIESRPYLSLYSVNRTDTKSLKIINHGLGPAIIQSAEFAKRGPATARVADLFTLPHGANFDFKFRLSSDTIIAHGNERVLMQLTAGELEGAGKTEAEVDKVMKYWKAHKSGIAVVVKYKDIFGKLHTLEDTLN